ncbi:MAG: cytochrome c [Flammeovirgaceae bacterium]
MKSKFVKIFFLLLGIAVLLIGVLLTYVKTALPNVGVAPDLKVESTPEILERGRYLAHHVVVCIDCHSTRDWSKYAAPPIDGTWGKGGEIFDQNIGLPGFYTSKNITPAGISSWTDGELFRVITCGVDKDGKALFPIMPYQNYGQMDEEDIKAIIAYIKTLAPIENKPQESVSDFPMNFIINTIPQKANLQKRPDKTDVIAYGKYMTNAAACIECHTKAVRGEKLKGMEFAGGFEFPLPSGGVVRSSNITPHPESGIGNWTKEAFIRRFKLYADSSYQSPTVEKGAMNTVMPWIMYAGMTEEDLGAIYEYLRTVPAIDNKVERFTSN